jgi:Ca-activated chloride channel family protein
VNRKRSEALFLRPQAGKKEEEAMKSETKKTIAILGAAGTLVAAAMILDNTAGGSTSKSTIGGETPIAKTEPARCDTDAPARADKDFGRGTLRAALSAGKILRGSGGQIHAAFELTAGQAALGERPPLNLSIVIDRSGSMAGDRLEFARNAAIGIIDRLGERDRVALIQYDDSAQVVVSSIPTDAGGKDRLRGAIRELQVGGSTNLHEGMTLGRDEVQRTLASGQVSRIILLSDGRANAGVVDQTAIADTARAAANTGVRITSVGVGLDYNEDLMEAIAEAGRGNYYYVKNSVDLEKVMAGEMAGIQATVATAVELRLNAACAGVEITDVHGYEMRREGGLVIVPMADLFGGDSRKLLVQVKVPDRQNGRLGAIQGQLSFRDARSGETRTASIALAVEVTDDHAAANGSIDKDVMAEVLKAQAVVSMRQAAQAYEKGDKEGAISILRATESKLEADAGRYGVSAQAAAPAIGGLRGMADEAAMATPGSEDGKDLLKKNKARARDMSKGKRAP